MLIGALALLSAPSFAQISKINTLTTLSTFIRGVDVAHDESGGGLIVGGVDYIYAQCIGSDGVASGTVLMKPAQGHPFGSFPRARFNPNAGNFLVVWPEEQTNGMLLKARTIACPSGAMGATITVSGGSPYGERGPGIDFSRTSGKFLVAYETITHVTQVQLLAADGTALTGPITVSAGQGENPSVTWNSVRDEFGVSISDNDGQSSALALVPASNPSGFRRTAFNSLSGAKAFMTDVAFNSSTQHYLMAWYQDVAGTRYAKVAEFDNSGGLIGFGTAANFGSYDALGIAYNRNSGTSAIVGIDGSDELRVAELNANGVRFASDQTLSTGFNPVRYPRVDASATTSRFFATVSRGSGSPNFSQFQGIGEVVLQTGTTGGGPGGSYTGGGGTTSGGGSTGGTTGGCTTVQPGPGWTCVNGGWLPPTTSTGGTSTGSTGSCTTVQPGAGWTCVNGSWLPPGSTTTTTTSTSSCKTVQPGAGWTCVNGNWLPPGSTTTGGTTTTSTSSCTTVQPGAGWVCQNGGWLPPGSSLIVSTNDGTCSGTAPVAGWYCRQGNWLPPDSPLILGGTFEP